MQDCLCSFPFPLFGSVFFLEVWLNKFSYAFLTTACKYAFQLALTSCSFPCISVFRIWSSCWIPSVLRVWDQAMCWLIWGSFQRSFSLQLLWTAWSNVFVSTYKFSVNEFFRILTRVQIFRCTFPCSIVSYESWRKPCVIYLVFSSKGFTAGQKKLSIVKSIMLDV